MYVVNLGPYSVDFTRFLQPANQKIWHYKLNPYISSQQKELEKLITVSSKQDIDDLKDINSLITKELSRISYNIYSEYVHLLKDGSYSLTVMRRDTRKVHLFYKINSEWDKIQLLFSKEDESGHIAFEYLGILMPYCGLKYNTITFHGVLMEYQNKGIIISAPSGTGKTTHARLWRDLKRTLIINGDKATCQKVDGVWTGFGLPWSGTSGEQINRNVLISALVILEQGEVNEAGLITGLEAFGAVLPHIQCPTWEKELAEKAIELLEDFLRDIPIIRLRCRPDEESVEVLSKLIEGL